MDLTGWQLTLELVGVFALATLAGWLVGALRRLLHSVRPVPGAKVRIRGERRVYRCRLEAISTTRWTLSPPLVRDDNFPMTPGEKIVGEVAVPEGRLLFRTVLECVDEFRGRLWIRSPKRTFLVAAHFEGPSEVA
jgi:hypothetical protein